MSGLFTPEKQYGEGVADAMLNSEAPISGTPIPGTDTTNKPTLAAAAPMGPGVQASPYVAPPAGVDYYAQLAKRWNAMARTEFAGPHIQAHAANARSYAHKVKHGVV